MSETGDTAGGLFASIRKLFQSVLTVLQNRVELLAVEVQEDDPATARAERRLGLGAVDLGACQLPELAVNCAYSRLPLDNSSLACGTRTTLYHVAGAVSWIGQSRKRNGDLRL